MFLKSLRIENARCIKDAEIDFEQFNTQTDKWERRKWTFLVGDNGTGKSTVLKAIALLMSGSDALVDLLRDAGSWVRNGARSCRITGIITTAKNEEREISLTLARRQTVRQLLAANEDSLQRLDAALKHASRSYLTIAYGSTRITSHSGGISINDELFRHPRSLSMATMFSRRARLIPFEEWAVDLYSRRDVDAHQIIQDALNGLLPNTTFKKFDPRSGRLLFDTPDGVVPLRYLSDGFQKMLGFCGDLLHQILRIHDDYKHPLDARGLLLIDELSLELHPVWQRKLVEFLTHRLPNFQIVTTTNKPLTAHQAGEGELYFFRREKMGRPPVLHQFEGSPSNLLLHQLILSPVFGVETANSYAVECMQDEHERLKQQHKMTARERTQVADLERSLSEVTDWSEVSEADRKVTKLLERIENKLQTNS